MARTLEVQILLDSLSNHVEDLFLEEQDEFWKEVLIAIVMHKDELLEGIHQEHHEVQAAIEAEYEDDEGDYYEDEDDDGAYGLTPAERNPSMVRSY